MQMRIENGMYVVVVVVLITACNGNIRKNARADDVPQNTTTMEAKTIVHKADSRGHARHSWLETWHTFSFAGYYDPGRIQFGALCVINDDIIDGGQGFGTHPHDNMEIITIPLSGALEHRDNMENVEVIRAGEVQVMRAGTGITHSEYNHNKKEPVSLLQIWVLPDTQNVNPRYDKIELDSVKHYNEFIQIVSPDPGDPGVWIHQQAWFSLGDLKKDASLLYTVKRENNGVYVFVIDGTVTVNGKQLSRRDGMGLRGTDTLNIQAITEARVLLMDIPMDAAQLR